MTVRIKCGYLRLFTSASWTAEHNMDEILHKRTCNFILWCDEIKDPDGDVCLRLIHQIKYMTRWQTHFITSDFNNAIKQSCSSICTSAYNRQLKPEMIKWLWWRTDLYPFILHSDASPEPIWCQILIHDPWIPADTWFIPWWSWARPGLQPLHPRQPRLHQGNRTFKNLERKITSTREQ